MRKRDRDWMVAQIKQSYQFGITQFLRQLYADGRSIPGAIVNQMVERLSEVIREHAPRIRDTILALPETEQRLAEWDQLRRGEDA